MVQPPAPVLLRLVERPRFFCYFPVPLELFFDDLIYSDVFCAARAILFAWTFRIPLLPFNVYCSLWVLSTCGGGD